MLEQLQAIFRKVFMDPQLQITENTSAKDIRMWDSLTHLELIALVEEGFDVKFSFDEVMQFNNVGDMMRLIAKKK